MKITEKMKDEFKEIYFKEHGKELTDEEAYEGACSLLGFTKIVLFCGRRKETQETINCNKRKC